MDKKMKVRREFFGTVIYNPENYRLKCVEKNALVDTESVVLFDNSRDGILSAPFIVFLRILDNCNLECNHCLLGRLEKKTLMSTEDCKMAIKKIAELGVLELRIGGGEPTLHPGFFEITEFAKSQGLTVAVNSNGIYDYKVLEKLCNSKIDRIHVSLDGLKENHERIRGESTFDKTINSIEQLRSAGKYVRIVSCFDKKSSRDILGLIKLSENLGCDIKFSPIAKRGNAKSLKTIVSENELNEILGKISKAGGRINIFFNSGLMAEKSHKKCGTFDYGSTYCGSRKTQMHIEPSGKVFVAGCGGPDKEKPSGSIASDFELLWVKEQEKFKKILEKNNECKSCDLGSVLMNWVVQKTACFNFKKEDFQ